MVVFNFGYYWCFNIQPAAKDLLGKNERAGYSISQQFPFWEQLKMPAPYGKKREIDCANTESILRIIQSIHSPKAEPLNSFQNL